MKTRALMLPGLYDSGPEHWQSCWERSEPSFVRINQRDWETPDRAEWVETLDRAVDRYGAEVVLVGHSTACALIAFWARETGRSVRGALIVGPSDTEAPSYPRGPTGFSPMPLHRINFPTIVVASSNDEYVSIERAEQFARAWGSRLVNVGAEGHINSASALGDWPRGRALLGELLL
jgi:predicted alpha/beta hydrolase family esterase